MKKSLPHYLVLALALLLAAGCTGGEPDSSAGMEPEGFSSEEIGVLLDIDGNSYPALQIGEQVWMGSNLLATRGPDGEPVESFCYDDQEENCQEYGRLYTMSAARGGDSGEGAQGICPQGWHIPSMSEWKGLIDYLGGQDLAGKELKEAGTAHWVAASSGNGGQSGMEILPSGWYDFTLEFRGLGESCFLRSSSAPNSYSAYIWVLEAGSEGIRRGDLHPDDAIPLRCLKD